MIVINYIKKLESLGFPVGTKVVMTGDDPCHFVKKGQTGIVCHYTNDWEDVDGCNIGVEWDEKSHSFHNCMSHCKNLHGRYVPHTSLSNLDLDLGSFETSDFDFDFLIGVNT